jgi:Ser/Thr protein kinase RdoA (MazF antagonist)
MLEIPVTKIRRALNKDLIDLVDSATAKIQSAIEGIEQHREVYGLIHGNLLLRNFLVHGGEIRVVDFDHCGWGFFGYDLAVTLSQLVGQPKSPQLRAAFLKGYQQVRLVGAEIESLLGVFIGARYVYEILRLAGNKNDDDTEKETLPQIKRYSEYLERFLQRR